MDSNPIYGTINTNKCGSKTYTIVKSAANQFPNTVASLITLSGLTINVHPVVLDPPGTYDFDLIVTIYSSLVSQTFSITINCTPNLTTLPVISNVTVVAMVSSTTVSF